MKKSILTAMFAFAVLFASAQVKVYSGKQVGVASTTTTTPSYSFQVTTGDAGVTAGDMDIATSTKGYKIAGNYFLWNNGNTTDVFVGRGAGNASMSNHYNTCVGNNAGNGITTGSLVCTYGYKAGQTNTSANYNTMVGSYSGAGGTITGGYNSFLGYGSGYNQSSGTNNIALGHNTLYYNATGSKNTAVGYEAGRGYSSGNNYSHSTFVGYQAGVSTKTGGDYNTAVGESAGGNNWTGTNNTCLGYLADLGGNAYTNATAIGNGAIVTGNNLLQLGSSTCTYVLTYSGSYGTGSDKRFKINVKEEVKGLEFINKLRPVTYQMDTKQFDDFVIQNMPDSVKTKHQSGIDFAPSTSIIHSGFIAQEVDSVAQLCGFKSSIVHLPSGNADPYALTYGEFVVPLVKAVQEQQTMIDNLLAEIAALKTRVVTLENK